MQPIKECYLQELKESDAIFQYASAGDLEMMKFMIEKLDVDFNKKDEYNTTPLHLTIYFAYESSFQYLLSLGADMNNVDGNGDSCFDLLVELNEVDMSDIYYSHLIHRVNEELKFLSCSGNI